MNNVLATDNTLQQTPGQIIKEVRKAGQISLNEVSQRLLLSKQILTAIEEDDYSKIPASVYAEGYLKAYAKFLQIPFDNVINSFRCLNVYPDGDVESSTEPQNKINIYWLVNLLAYFKKIPRTVLLVILLALILGGAGIIYNIVKVINTPDLSTFVMNEGGVLDNNEGSLDKGNNTKISGLETRLEDDVVSPIIEERSLDYIKRNVPIPLDTISDTQYD